MKKPVIDEMYELIIRGDLDKLENISRPEDAIHIRSAISTSNAAGVGLTINLEDITSRAPWITPLFAGPKIYFTSASTALQSLISHGKSKVLIDWSFSFDSNVAEKVRAYVNHESINESDRNRVITLLRLKKEYSLQTDLIPFLFENLRLSRDNKSNERPLNTILAFKKLDYLDWASFENNPLKPAFNCDEEKLSQECIRTYNKLVNTAEVKNRERKALLTQVILFELSIIWLKGERSPEAAFTALIDFCVIQLKKLPKYELMFAWKFLSNPSKVRFFGPLSGVGKDLAKSLRGMAWDMSHMRTLETMCTKSDSGSFFVPFFVSFDEKFSEILKQNQIHVLLMDDRLKRMHSIGMSEAAFQVKLNSCMSPQVLENMTFTSSEARRTHEISEFELQHILENQTTVLESLANTIRSARKNKNSD
ncbi:hypothetical protein [Pseudomonas sp. GM60]|uniref:hypothetical protein n=1 Tax=Pseudomonas sp. GM60 TaxID=1144334 RepID=UPI0002706E63|nr:hypothetical protein [Pseudomonas sp. GM60]EJM80473.1 hypothetical protein PMI32_03593 [Pseudomonas sp. GM60]